MPDYFFDTSVLVAYFKNEDSRTLSLIGEVISGRMTAAISAITVAEVWATPAMGDPSVQRQRQALLALLQIVAIDRQVAEQGGTLRRRHSLDIPDALIAACCHSAGGHFLTKDPHFNRLLDIGLLSGEVYS